MICNLCPRQCNAIRTETENTGGYCGQPLLPRLARAALHFYEEPIISGKNGSGAVFFSGCNLGCVYCQNSDISQNMRGKTVSINRLAQIIKELEEKGAENINLVTPSHYTKAIIAALDIYRPSIPIVYNSSGYDTAGQIEALRDYIDVYLFDYKYSDIKKAAAYSNAPDYPATAQKAIFKAYEQKGNAVIKNSLIKSGVIVRHLLLPRATNDAIKIFDFVNDNLPGAYFSLMAQYTPLYKAAGDGIINRKITKREYDKVAEHIISSGCSEVFLQDLESADTKYIPPFDFDGI